MEVERPTVAPPAGEPMAWASDAFAELLRRLELPYLSLNPGASYRGLHDSVVNYLVGLMHATMALYTAFCDRVPMLVLGATGPLDAALRRPWIDWIHTSADQGALIRNYVKWDDQPGSVAAALEAIMRADTVTRSYPCAPVYVCLDSALQEQALQREPQLPDVSRHRAPPAPAGDAAAIAAAVAILARSRRPLILIGRVSRDQGAWDARVTLAERLGALVITDLKVAAAFPSDHPRHPLAPATFLPPGAAELLADADAILALDWVDLGGTLKAAFGEEPPPAQVISVSADAALHNGWSKDHFALAPSDLAIAAHPDPFVAQLLAALPEEARAADQQWPPPAAAAPRPASPAGEAITVSALAVALRDALAGSSSCLVRAPLGWSGADWPISGPLDYLGQDGGAGLGSGPGMAVGAALALAGSGRIPVAVLGDGDFLMGATALWSAARYRLPLLVIVANNRTFLNDEIHQERVAAARGRPIENRWVGQQIADPDPDLAGLARSLGLRGFGPVTARSQLAGALEQALAAVAAGEPALVDVVVLAGDYPGAPAAGEED
jgi:thiamine pyrophosphate-dependent acetolactate synthase large subunit-like protein